MPLSSPFTDKETGHTAGKRRGQTLDLPRPAPESVLLSTAHPASAGWHAVLLLGPSPGSLPGRSLSLSRPLCDIGFGAGAPRERLGKNGRQWGVPGSALPFPIDLPSLRGPDTASVLRAACDGAAGRDQQNVRPRPRLHPAPDLHSPSCLPTPPFLRVSHKRIQGHFGIKAPSHRGRRGGQRRAFLFKLFLPDAP